MNWYKQAQTQTYYHGTDPESAENILRNGIDPSRYRSGMFIGFYVTPNPAYFSELKHQTILKLEIDESKIINEADISDKELGAIDPNFRMTSYGYKNHLKTQYALSNGYGGIRNGKEVILFNQSPIKHIEKVNLGTGKLAQNNKPSYLQIGHRYPEFSEVWYYTDGRFVFRDAEEGGHTTTEDMSMQHKGRIDHESQEVSVISNRYLGDEELMRIKTNILMQRPDLEGFKFWHIKGMQTQAIP